MMFELNARLENDSLFICDLDFCQLRLFNDSRYIWCLLIPRTDKLTTEIHHLPPAQQITLWNEINFISQVLEQEFPLRKLNVGALGNIVSQLHIHLVIRTETDPAWPGPVWGHSPASPYTEQAAEQVIQRIKKHL